MKMTAAGKILEVMRENGGRARPAELRAALGVTQAAVQRQLLKMSREGKVEKVGAAPKVYYQIRPGIGLGPDKNLLFPNPKLKTVAFVKNLPPREGIEIGDFTYYADPAGHPERFYERIKDEKGWESETKKGKRGQKLTIGKFCQIMAGVTFILRGEGERPERLAGATSYPFEIFGGGWEKATSQPLAPPTPLSRPETIIGHDVWIGPGVTFYPGVKIGDGAVIRANSTVVSDVASYSVVGGNPAVFIKWRFEKAKRKRLAALEWWNWDEARIFENLEQLTRGEIAN